MTRCLVCVMSKYNRHWLYRNGDGYPDGVRDDFTTLFDLIISNKYVNYDAWDVATLLPTVGLINDSRVGDKSFELPSKFEIVKERIKRPIWLPACENFVDSLVDYLYAIYVGSNVALDQINKMRDYRLYWEEKKDQLWENETTSDNTLNNWAKEVNKRFITEHNFGFSNMSLLKE